MSASTPELWLVALVCAGPRVGLRRALRLEDGERDCRIGRSAEAELSVPLASLSPLHACVARADLGLTVQDLHSLQGSRLNGRRLEPGQPVPFRPGDELKLGALRVSLWAGRAEERPDGRALAERLAARLFGPDPEPSAELWVRVEDGPGRGAEARLELGRSLCVGRAAECDLRVPDRRVSRRHARLIPCGSGCLVRDLGSALGLRLDGRRLTGEARIEPGQVLGVGAARLRLVSSPGGGSAWQEPLGPPPREALSDPARYGLARLGLLLALAGSLGALLWGS